MSPRAAARLSAAAPSRRRATGEQSSGRTIGGLGRDLGVILDDGPAAATSRPRGLDQLLGGPAARPPTVGVRQVVVEAAMTAMAEAFDTDALVVVHRAGALEAPVVASRLPAGWPPSGPDAFDLFGRVWSAVDRLHRAAPDATEPTAAQHGQPDASANGNGHHPSTWTGGRRVGDGVAALGLVRASALARQERRALDRLLVTVAGALGPAVPFARSSSAADGNRPANRRPGRWRPAAARPRVRVEAEADDRWRAEIRGFPGMSTGRGAGPTEAMAVADAARVGLGRAAPIRLAGVVAIDGAWVSVVMADPPAAGEAPTVGVAVSDRDGPHAVIDAVRSTQAATRQRS